MQLARIALTALIAACAGPALAQDVSHEVRYDEQQIVASPKCRSDSSSRAPRGGSTSAQFQALIDRRTQRHKKIIVDKNISATE